MAIPAGVLARLVGARLCGGDPIDLTGVSDIEHALPGDLVFVEHPEDLDRALASCASGVVAPSPPAAPPTDKAVLVSDQPRLAFARMAASLRRSTGSATPGIHPSAVVDPGATVDASASVCRDAVIEAAATIGPGTTVGIRSVIERDVRIGRDCDIGPHVVIHSGTHLGDRVCVQAGSVLGSTGFGYVCDQATGRHERFPQSGGLTIEDDVDIGANVTIDRGTFGPTVVGRGTKIDNLVHVAHNVRIGEDVVIAAMVGIAGSAVIGDRVVLAGQVGVADHVRIQAGVKVGAQAGVPTRKVLRDAGQVYWGTPARPLRDVLKELAALARLAKR